MHYATRHNANRGVGRAVPSAPQFVAQVANLLYSRLSRQTFRRKVPKFMRHKRNTLLTAYIPHATRHATSDGRTKDYCAARWLSQLSHQPKRPEPPNTQIIAASAMYGP